MLRGRTVDGRVLSISTEHGNDGLSVDDSASCGKDYEQQELCGYRASTHSFVPFGKNIRKPKDLETGIVLFTVPALVGGRLTQGDAITALATVSITWLVISCVASIDLSQPGYDDRKKTDFPRNSRPGF